MKVSFVIFTLLTPILCACSAKISFIDRTDGQVYYGQTGGTAGSGGEATANISGKTYTGPWIYSATGGGYSLGSMSTAATVTSPRGIASAYGTGTATGLMVSAQGNGLMNLRSADGSFIRCVFTFNTMSNTGIGQCLRNDGKEYDFTASR